MNRFCRDLRLRLGDKRGNVIITFALMLPVVVGGAGFGVETTYWYYKRLALQAAADAAAYSGAIERRSGSGEDAVHDAAEMAATDNGFDTGAGTLQVVETDLSGGGSVEVNLDEKVDRFFTAYFVNGQVTIKAKAVATYNSASTACILALHTNQSKAANFSGSSTLNLTGCSVMANSVASDAVNVQGSGQLKTECVISAGGVSATAGLTMSKCTTPVTQAPPVADPYKNVPAPTPTGPCRSAPNNNGTVSEGHYCSGMDLKGDVTLNPGVYYLSGDLRINSTANVVGAGVTIYLAAGAHVVVNGTPHVDLSAPTTGVYSGILFFGDRAGSGDNKFTGDAASKLTGAIYFASQKVTYQGNFSGTNGCTRVVASTVEWTGNTTVAANCKAQGMDDIKVLAIVRLTA